MSFAGISFHEGGDDMLSVSSFAVHLSYRHVDNAITVHTKQTVLLVWQFPRACSPDIVVVWEICDDNQHHATRHCCLKHGLVYKYHYIQLLQLPSIRRFQNQIFVVITEKLIVI